MEDLSFAQYIKASRIETEKCKKVSSNVREPVSYISDVKYISNDSDSRLPQDLKPFPEWSKNLQLWFAHVRQQIIHFNSNENEKFSFQELVVKIERNEFPTVDSIKSLKDSSSILFYFYKRQSEFTHSDLCWIFGALTVIDKLMGPDMCECIQSISQTVRKQIRKSGRDDKLYPYLSVINDLIVNYFHQY